MAIGLLREARVLRAVYLSKSIALRKNSRQRFLRGEARLRRPLSNDVPEQ